MASGRVVGVKRGRLIPNGDLVSSYDLDMDKRLSEETTTLVESYTVSLFPLRSLGMWHRSY